MTKQVARSNIIEFERNVGPRIFATTLLDGQDQPDRWKGMKESGKRRWSKQSRETENQKARSEKKKPHNLSREQSDASISTRLSHHTALSELSPEESLLSGRYPEFRSR